MILLRNQKDFFISSVYKHLKGILAYRAPDWKKPATRKQFFFQKRPVQRMNEEICCVTNKRKTAKNEWGNDDSYLLRALYCVNKN